MRFLAVVFALSILSTDFLAGAAEPAPASIDANSTFALWFRPGADPLRALRAFEQVKSRSAGLRVGSSQWASHERRFSDPGVAFLLPFFLPDSLGKLPRKPYLATPAGYAFEILEANARASLRALHVMALSDEEHLAVLTEMKSEFGRIASLPPTKVAPPTELGMLASRIEAVRKEIESHERLLITELADLRTLGGMRENASTAKLKLAHLAEAPKETALEARLSSWEERQASLLSLFALSDTWGAEFGLVTRTEALPVPADHDPFDHFLLKDEYEFPPFHLLAARLTSDAARPLRERSLALSEERPRLLAALRDEVSGASRRLQSAQLAETMAARGYRDAYTRFAIGAGALPNLLATADQWSTSSHQRVERMRDLDEAKLRLACATDPEEAERIKP